MTWQMASLLLLGGSTVLLFAGMPVAISFIAINLIGAFLFLGGDAGLHQVARNSVAAAINFSLTPIPLFILMGEVLFHTGLALKVIDPAYQSPTAGSCCCSPCRHSPDAHKRSSRDRSSAGTTRSASPLRAGLWSTSLCSTAHPSATTSRRRVSGPPRVPVVAVAHDPAHRGAVGRPDGTIPGAGPAPDQGVLSGGVLDCGGGDLGDRRTSVQLGGGRTPAPGTLRSTRRVAQGARRVRGRSMLTGTVLMWSSRSESQSSGWARAA